MKNNSFIYYFYTLLTKNHFELTISDYLTALKVIRSGWGWNGEEDLLRIFKILWLKDEEKESKFSYLLGEALKTYQTKFQNSDIPDRSLNITPPQKIKNLPDNQFEVDQHTEVQDDLHRVPTEKNLEIKRDDFKSNKFSAIFENKPKAFYPHDFYLGRDYFSLNQRSVIQLFRKLRIIKELGYTDTLDVESTLRSFYRSGFFAEIHLRKVRKNVSTVIFLIDLSEGMLAFQIFADKIIESVKKDSFYLKVKVRYFLDLSDEFFFSSPNYLHSEDFSETFQNLEKKLTYLIIISDAQSALGIRDISYVNRIKRFFKYELNVFKNNIIWLNPMPQIRWTGTSAEEIEKNYVKMFSLDEEGLAAGLQTLKSRILNQ